MCVLLLRASNVLTSTLNADWVPPAAGVRALVYSGDLDWQVPWSGSQHWTSHLGAALGLLADWRAWFRPDPRNYGSQVALYFTPV